MLDAPAPETTALEVEPVILVAPPVKRAVGAAAARRTVEPTENATPEPSETPSVTVPGWRVLGSPELAEQRNRITRGFVKHRIVHFTFDDGPNPRTTPQLLDAMAEYGVQGTFFIVGRQLGGPSALERRALVQRMEEEGHTVAVHTHGHGDLSRLSHDQIDADLSRVEESLEATLGYRPGIFRPPYGRRSTQSNAQLRERGYTQVLWNYTPEAGARSPEAILRNFQNHLNRMERHPRGPGGIIIMHDIQPSSVEAFPALMDELRRRNCELLHQEGEELWDVAGDLSPFLLHGSEIPADLLAQRQTEIRRQARSYCSQ